jgi:hypothetical protein
MKIRSLVLGSVAAAGLSTAGYAADLGVLTSLDVCDSLGLSGLTISSDTNCLQISGGVEYEFTWGDYEGPSTSPTVLAGGAGTGVFGPTNTTIMAGNGGYDAFDIATPGNHNGNADRNNDWSSKVKAWVQFVGTAASDFGPASAVIKLQQKQYSIIKNEGGDLPAMNAVGFTNGQTNTLVGVGSSSGSIVIDRAYVSVGDTTVLTAGKIGTIMNFADDVPLNYLGLFQSSKVDTGVKWTKDLIPDGGHGIQITSDLGNGVKVGAALENLDGGKAATGAPTSTIGDRTATNIARAGTAVGVISYAGDGIAAHLTVVGGGVLDGVVENFGYHAGFSGTFDVVKVVAALSGDNTGYHNGLVSAAATFDIFTLAGSAEFVQQPAGNTDYGFGGSIGAAVTDTVSINVGGRYFRDNSVATASDSYQVAAQLVAAVTETITLTGEVGLYNRSLPPAPGVAANVYYGAATAEWKPGGGFTTSLKGEAYSNGAYKATFKAAKTFQ